MKTYRLYSAILMMALCFNFVSCGDDDDNNIIDSENVTKRLVRVVDTYDGEVFYALDFDYDSKGRVVSVSEDKNNYCNISYSENKATANFHYYDNDFDEYVDYNKYWTLDNQNNILSEDYGDENSGEVTKFTYTNGYCTKEVGGSELTYSETNYNYKDGLLINTDNNDYVDGVLINNYNNYNITYTDIPNKGNILVHRYIYEDFEVYSWAGLLGNSPRLLPEKFTWHDSGYDVTATFKYDLDKDGYVKRVTISEVSSNGDRATETLDFVYEDIK